MKTKIGVVIGGGNGIGAACCEVMAQYGWKVAAADLDLGAAQNTAARLDGLGYQVNIANLEAVEELAESVQRDLGPISGLVVAAAAFQEKFSPDELPLDLLHRVMTVNFEGAFNANRIFASRMARQGQGSIVNIASIAGHTSSPQHVYGPMKAAVVSMTKNFAAQYGKSGVRVNSVSPGAVIVPRVLARPPGRYAVDIDSQMALGRRIQPQEIANGVEFLLSERASAITGTDLLIDAGWMVANSWHLFGGVPGPVER
ncbi:SDR family oxidoreductase [Achromobacter marplatensis]|uniref:SDR family NAD(P)-dependent oxidoreductase n=1 Tax=Achromobacter marplatensis TaxID=470868 RepID=UPI0028E95D68|nr:SDR family oxidoreductase [Achromobacter marplatensis]